MLQDTFSSDIVQSDRFSLDRNLDLPFGVDPFSLKADSPATRVQGFGSPEEMNGGVRQFVFDEGETEELLALEDAAVAGGADVLLTGGQMLQSMKEAKQQAQVLLAGLGDRQDAETIFTTAFGKSTGDRAVADLLTNWSAGNFEDFPEIEVLTEGELGNALGAYAAETDTVYLSSGLLAGGDADLVANVLLEEIGHGIDLRINAEDSPGDEGAIFSALIRDEDLADTDLRILKDEKDDRFLQLGDQPTWIEQAIIERTGGFEGDSQTIQLDSADGGAIDLSYQMYEVQDQLQLKYAGEVVFDSGLTSGGRSVRLELPQGKNTDTLEVILTPNQTIDTTQWVYRVNTSSTDIYPLRADADFQEVSNNTFQANGLIQIGLADGPFPLVTLEGSASYDPLKFEADGKITPSIGDLQLPVWQEGSFTINIGEKITNFLSDTANSELNDIGVAGFEIKFSQLEFTERGIELEGVIDFPDNLGISDISVSGDNKILIDNTGISITGADISIEDFKFKLADAVELEASDLSLGYVHVPEAERGIKLQGKAKIDSFFGAEADFAGENYIKLNNNSDPKFDVIGSISVEDIKIVPNVWEIQSAKLSVNSQNKSILGEASLLIPTGIILGGSLGFIGGQFDSAGLSADGLNKPIGTTGAVLQGIGGNVKNLASEPKDDDEFGGKLRVTAGPEVSLNLPSWAGDNFTGSVADFEVDGSFNAKRIQAAGNIKLLGGAITGTTDLLLSLDRKTLAANANFSALEGLITFAGNLKADSDLNFGLVSNASVQVPDIIPLIGGQQLAEAITQVAFSNNGNLSDDFIAGWGSIDNVPFKGKITKGFKLFMDGEFKVVGDSEIPETNSFAVEPGTDYVVLGADWENPSNDAIVQIISPDGSVFEPQDFPEDKIAMIDNLTSDTTAAVIIDNPEAGIWDIKLSNEAELGNIEYTAFRDSQSPQILIDSPSTDVSGDRVEIGYNFSDEDSNATVSFFYDTDNTGYDGTLIQDGIAEPDGLGNFTWDIQGVPTGEYYVYAVATDENNPPVLSNYSSGRVLVTEEADLSISQTSNLQSVQPGEKISYSLNIVNNGSTSSESAIVTTELLENATFVSSSLEPVSQENGNLSFDLGVLNPGESRNFELTIQPNEEGRSDIISRVTSNTFDSNSSNDVSVISTDVEFPENLQSEADISLEINSPDSVNLGDPINYNLIVKNNGTQSANDVELTSILPLGVNVVSSESDRGITSTTSNILLINSTSNNIFDDLPQQRTDERVIARLGTLEPGETANVSIFSNSFSSGSLINSASVTSSSPESNLANNTVRKSVTVLPTPPQPTDLELTQLVNGVSVSSGNQVLSTLSVSNTGNGIASGIEVLDTLPSEVTLVSATPSQGTYDPTTGIWQVGNLRDGVSASLNLLLESNGNDFVTNTAEIVSMSEIDTDSTPGNGNPDEDDFSSLTFDFQGTALSAATSKYAEFLQLYGLL